MTTGNVLLEPDFATYTYNAVDPWGETRVYTADLWTGPYLSKEWNGGNSPRSKNVVPRISRLVLPPVPKRIPKPRKGSYEYASDREYYLYLANKTSRKAALAEIARLKAERALFMEDYRRRVSDSRRLRQREKYTLKRQPMNYTMDKVIGQLGAYRWDNGQNFGWTNVWPLDKSHLPWDTADEYKLINKLRDKVLGTGFHPGITAAEMPKALSMIGDAARKLRLALLAISEGNWRGVVRNLGRPTEALYGKARWSWLSFKEGRMSISQLWLEFQYGWKPLVMDIEQAAGYIAYALNEPSAVSRRIAAKRSSYNRATDLCPYGEIRPNTMYTISTVKYTITDLAMDSRFEPNLASVASVAWEVLPYSFVADWVAPVSGYLEALRFASSLRGNVVRSFKQETHWLDPMVGGAQLFQLSNISTECQRISFSRSVSHELFVMPPVGDLSPSSIFKNWTRAANAVALLQNLRLPSWDRTGLFKLTH